jgi:hypothetical protein
MLLDRSRAPLTRDERERNRDDLGPGSRKPRQQRPVLVVLNRPCAWGVVEKGTADQGDRSVVVGKDAESAWVSGEEMKAVREAHRARDHVRSRRRLRVLERAHEVVVRHVGFVEEKLKRLVACSDGCACRRL